MCVEFSRQARGEKRRHAGAQSSSDPSGCLQQTSRHRQNAENYDLSPHMCRRDHWPGFLHRRQRRASGKILEKIFFFSMHAVENFFSLDWSHSLRESYSGGKNYPTCLCFEEESSKGRRIGTLDFKKYFWLKWPQFYMKFQWRICGKIGAIHFSRTHLLSGVDLRRL